MSAQEWCGLEELEVGRQSPQDLAVIPLWT
jgi:hypothetical protein